MQVRSLGLATDLGLLARRGTVVDRGDYMVATSPGEPSYYYGNLLVLPAPPQIGEVAYWTRRFTDELGRDPAIKHVTFRWDGITGEVGARAELEAAGFTIEIDQVMCATTIEAAPTAFPIRPLGPADIAAVTALGFAIGDRHDEAFRRFNEHRGVWKRALVETGEAAFWGAFDGGELVGSLGLVPLGTIGRYQDVQTAPTHRKRGIAGALLAAAARAQPACTTFAIVATPGSDAARLYERVGFQIAERTGSACRYPT